MHVVLLGDSIFDNKSYTSGAPDVRQNLARLLPEDSVTLLAFDGASMPDIDSQLRKLPEYATHLVLSIGGNDLLSQIQILGQRASTVSEAFATAAQVVEAFSDEYADTLEAVRSRGLPVVVCTIYNPYFPDPVFNRVIPVVLSPFNTAIVLHAMRGAYPVIDLRLVATEPQDIVSSIEPSGQGGAKIARAIATVLREHDFTAAHTILYP